MLFIPHFYFLFTNTSTNSFVPNCKVGVYKMHQGDNYQDFLKCRCDVCLCGGGVFLGHSLIIIK